METFVSTIASFFFFLLGKKILILPDFWSAVFFLFKVNGDGDNIQLDEEQSLS